MKTRLECTSTLDMFWCEWQSNMCKTCTSSDCLVKMESHLIAAQAIRGNFHTMNPGSVWPLCKKLCKQVLRDKPVSSNLAGLNLLKWICKNEEVITGSTPDENRSEAKKTFGAKLHCTTLQAVKQNVDRDTVDVACGADKEVSNKITKWVSFPL